jgi:hypothetical protein
VDTLTHDAIDDEILVHNCMDAIQKLEESQTGQMDQIVKIHKKLKTVMDALGHYKDNQRLSAVRPEPPSPRIREVRLYRGVFLVWYFPITM